MLAAGVAPLLTETGYPARRYTLYRLTSDLQPYCL